MDMVMVFGGSCGGRLGAVYAGALFCGSEELELRGRERVVEYRGGLSIKMSVASVLVSDTQSNTNRSLVSCSWDKPLDGGDEALGWPSIGRARTVA